jgi:hypothetical protein
MHTQRRGLHGSITLKRSRHSAQTQGVLRIRYHHSYILRPLLTQAGRVFGASFFADVVSGSFWDGRAGFFKLDEATGARFFRSTHFLHLESAEFDSTATHLSATGFFQDFTAAGSNMAAVFRSSTMTTGPGFSRAVELFISIEGFDIEALSG